MNYLDRFLSLRCAGDILGICNPINNVTKEITEAMALIMRVRSLALNEPMKYNVLDLCAGNALTSVISSMLLPVTYSVAVDIYKRNRKWEKIKRFTYKELDIYTSEVFALINKDTIIVSSHPCSYLALRVAELFIRTDAKATFILPCCNDHNYTCSMFKGNSLIQSKLSKYELWCSAIFDYLSDNQGVKTDIRVDSYCLSSKNIVVSAIKSKESKSEKSL